VQLQANKGELAKKYLNGGYETFDKTGDLYCLFYERGFNLLDQSGVLVYITSDKWMCCGYGESLRKYILEKTLPRLLVDFSGQRIFETATVETNILVLRKTGRHDFRGCVISDETAGGLAQLILDKQAPLEFAASEFWVIKNPQEQALAKKIARYGVPLREWDVEINFGIKTGLDEAFLVNEDLHNALIEADSSSMKILRPIFRGKDIGRYAPNTNEVWVIATFPSRQLNIDDFPVVKRHLLSFDKRVLEQSGEKNIDGIKGKNARKKTGNKWFETQDQISFYHEFSKPKVMWKRIGSSLRFCYSEQEVYGKDTTCMLTGENVKYLTAFLNSKMAAYLLKDSPRTGTGDLLVSVQAMEPLLVARPTDVENKAIVSLLDRILLAKKTNPNADTSALEDEIDQLVYKLYNLTPEEIAIVEGNGEKTSGGGERTKLKVKVTKSVSATAMEDVVDDYEELD